jgi:glycerophosphoryl diester phosphodiesterase
MVTIYGHRGASAELPENTLPAFALAKELGAYGIELDVHLSRDGVPVVIHDESVNRTTDGSGDVADLDLAVLRQFDAGNGATIPTLAEVLDLVGDTLHVDIEAKAAAAADAVLAETAGRPGLRFAISSFDHGVLRHVRSRDAGIELWPLIYGVTTEAIVTAKELGSPRLAANDTMLNEEIIEFAGANGLEIWVWTVNDPDRAEQLVGWGATGICTDDPRAMLAG